MRESSLSGGIRITSGAPGNATANCCSGHEYSRQLLSPSAATGVVVTRASAATSINGRIRRDDSPPDLTKQRSRQSFSCHEQSAGSSDPELQRVLAVLSPGTCETGNPALAPRRHADSAWIGGRGSRDVESVVSAGRAVCRIRSGLRVALSLREEPARDISLSAVVLHRRSAHDRVMGDGAAVARTYPRRRLTLPRLCPCERSERGTGARPRSPEAIAARKPSEARG